jgi:hypothetical protein
MNKDTMKPGNTYSTLFLDIEDYPPDGCVVVDESSVSSILGTLRQVVRQVFDIETLEGSISLELLASEIREILRLRDIKCEARPE